MAEAHPSRTVFTRFIPANRPGQGEGTWRRYYERWSSMTLENLGPEMIDLVPALQRFVPPGALVDKRVYSPWVEPGLDDMLRARDIDTIVVTGGETDVCVLATVLGAVESSPPFNLEDSCGCPSPRRLPVPTRRTPGSGSSRRRRLPIPPRRSFAGDH